MTSVRITPAFFCYLLAFSSAFGIYSTGIATVGLTPINIVSILIIPFFTLYCLYQQKIPDITLLGFLHLLYFMVALTGVLFAEDRFGALHGAGGYLIDYFLCFLYIVAFIKKRSQMETLAKVLVFVGFLSAAMGLTELVGYFFFRKIIIPPFAEFFWGPPNLKNYGFETGFYSIPGFVKMYGFFPTSSAVFGSYMLIPLGLVLYFSVQYKRFKGLYRGLAFLFALDIFLSGDRNAYVGGMILFLCLLFCFRREKQKPFSLVFRSAALGIIILAALAPFFLSRNSSFYDKSHIQVGKGLMIATPIFFLKRLNPFLESTIDKPKRLFSEHGKLALRYGTTHLGFGMGAQNFDEITYRDYPIKYGSHSNYILFLGDTGVWGLLVQVLIVLVSIQFGLKAYHNQPPGPRDHLPLFVLAIYLGLVGTGVVRTFYLTSHTFLINGMIAGSYLLNRQNHEHSHPNPRNLS